MLLCISYWLPANGMEKKGQQPTEKLLNKQLYKKKCPDSFNQVKLLMQQKADINATKKGYYNPLTLASIEQNVPLMDLFLKNGASINATTGSHCTPLMHSTDHGHYDSCKKLIEHKANLEIKDSDGYTALAHAVLKKKYPIVKLLLENNANIHASDSKDTKIFELSTDKNIMHLLTTHLIETMVPNKISFVSRDLIAQYCDGTITPYKSKKS